MFKSLLALSLLSSISRGYIGVESIEAYQNNVSEKTLKFNFNSDYTSVHEVYVKIEVFNDQGVLKAIHSNTLRFIGNKTATTKIDFGMETDFYILVDVMSSENIILDNAKLNFYFQKGCKLNSYNKECNRIYKSEYRSGISKDSVMNFKVRESTFNRFLPFNKLDLKKVEFYSNYDFKNGDIYLLIEDEIPGYDLPKSINGGYEFVLEIDSDKFNHFKSLNDYYLDLFNFKYSENQFVGSSKSKDIYFPYISEYKEYNCKVFIEDFLDIVIEFNVATSDDLFGECDISKYCLVRGMYD